MIVTKFAKLIVHCSGPTWNTVCRTTASLKLSAT